MPPTRDGRDASARRPSREVGGLGDPALPISVSVIFYGIRRSEAGDHSARGDILPTQNSGMFHIHFTHYVKEQEPFPAKKRALAPQTPICQHPTMETPASSFKLQANAPEGRKRFSIRIR